MSGNSLNRANLSLESLDQRTLPSVTAAFQGSFLVLTGDAASDTVAVEDVGNQIKVTVNGQVLGQLPRSALQGVVFIGGDGDDVFVNASSVLSVAVGGNGNDTLVGVGNGVNIFNGNEGNDILVGSGGDDILIGEAGDDVLFGRQGHDVIVGGDGHDREFGGHDANDTFDDRGTDPNDVFDDNGGASGGGGAAQPGDDRGRGGHG